MILVGRIHIYMVVHMIMPPSACRPLSSRQQSQIYYLGRLGGLDREAVCLEIGLAGCRRDVKSLFVTIMRAVTTKPVVTSLSSNSSLMLISGLLDGDSISRKQPEPPQHQTTTGKAVDPSPPRYLPTYPPQVPSA